MQLFHQIHLDFCDEQEEFAESLKSYTKERFDTFDESLKYLTNIWDISINVWDISRHSSSFWFCPLFCPLIHFPMYFALKFCPCPCPLFLPWTRGQKKRARAMAKFEGKIHGEMNQRAKKRFCPCPLFCWHFEGKGKTWGQKKGQGQNIEGKNTTAKKRGQKLGQRNKQE